MASGSPAELERLKSPANDPWESRSGSDAKLASNRVHFLELPCDLCAFLVPAEGGVAPPPSPKLDVEEGPRLLGEVRTRPGMSQLVEGVII